MTTSHLTSPAKDAGQVIGYSHSTRLPKIGSQAAGYSHSTRLSIVKSPVMSPVKEPVHLHSSVRTARFQYRAALVRTPSAAWSIHATQLHSQA